MQQAPLFQYQGLVAGVDEAGRGPLAGPVVAAAVILPTGHGIRGLDDSKKLSASRRESLAADVRAAALSCSVAWADAAEIDAMNILAATMLAMRRAILGLAVAPAAIQVDGNRLPKVMLAGRYLEGEAIVGGDGRIEAIAAASILAKTSRDRIMENLDRIHPNYAFAQHKGYGTSIHRERLQEHGPCEQHRRSFAPLRVSG